MLCKSRGNMTDYKVYGTGRENDCSGGNITHLTVETADGGKGIVNSCLGRNGKSALVSL